MNQIPYLGLQRYSSSPQFSGLFDMLTGGAASRVSASIAQTANAANLTIQQAQAAIEQGQEILTTTAALSVDAQSYLQRIQSIPVEQLAQRFDYKTKIATEELLSLSAFTQRALLYLCGIATLSLYLNMLTKRD